ncbi:hypothetical protein SAMN05216271_0745 [Halopseudomonas sabulinigri]|uniref:Uncharacterized protein n=1 Tax=Halopseudomonas sabulinigri TaxID=472181 RepID=A0A1H1N018_9GAMM|nr:hypothetical protein [Halopseudomonas sabulinigri]SDR92413.1 hypothetical protein SAMN05216271_0745 [Halopseudomonas sabulinigri]
MNKITQEMLATDLALWRKKGLFSVVLLLGLFPFAVIFVEAKPDIIASLWALRHFLGIAAIQAIAQTCIAWYLLKNPVPNYLILSFVLMVMFFQITFGLTVILLSNA